jgi:ABC-type nickel/cobalt efflux system permease component RcnA
VLLPLIIALLLGLRHAFDPDHLAAVSTLLLAQDRTPRQAGLLGLAWGLGHATTLCAFGLPVVLFSQFLPAPVQRAAEVIIGGVVVVLALRLLRRWQLGHFHVHPHQHGSIVHVHGHVHRTGDPDAASGHSHEHGEMFGRTPAASYGIGLVHGIGGSAGGGLLLMSTISSKAEGVIALLVFAAATAASMSLLSLGLAHTLARGAVRRRFPALIPVFGVASLLFGAWYSFGAFQGGL